MCPPDRLLGRPECSPISQRHVTNANGEILLIHRSETAAGLPLRSFRAYSAAVTAPS